MIKTKWSVEYIRGKTHRHHNLDYHSIAMGHGIDNPLHSFLSGKVYETIKGIKRGTKLSSLVLKIHDVITQIDNYEIIHGPFKAGEQAWLYTVRNTAKKRNYAVSIRKDKSFSCTCPAYINNTCSPCKHIILAAITKGHEVDI